MLSLMEHNDILNKYSQTKHKKKNFSLTCLNMFYVFNYIIHIYSSVIYFKTISHEMLILLLLLYEVK